MSERPMNSCTGGKIVLAAFASFALVAASTAPSAAASSTAPAKVVAATSEATDFSAAKRRHYRRAPNAAGLAIMGAATGLIAGAIAESQRRDYYEDRYYYGPGPGYYGGPAYAPAPAPYYGRPYGGGAVYHDPRVWGDPRY